MDAPEIDKFPEGKAKFFELTDIDESEPLNDTTRVGDLQVTRIQRMTLSLCCGYEVEWGQLVWKVFRDLQK